MVNAAAPAAWQQLQGCARAAAAGWPPAPGHPGGKARREAAAGRSSARTAPRAERALPRLPCWRGAAPGARTLLECDAAAAKHDAPRDERRTRASLWHAEPGGRSRGRILKARHAGWQRAQQMRNTADLALRRRESMAFALPVKRHPVPHQPNLTLPSCSRQGVPYMRRGRCALSRGPWLHLPARQPRCAEVLARAARGWPPPAGAAAGGAAARRRPAGASGCALALRRQGV